MNIGMPSSLDQAIEVVQPLVEQAQRILENCEDGDFLPTFFVFTSERGVDIIGLPHFGDIQEKAAAAYVMRTRAMLAQPLGLWGVMFVSDCRLWDLETCAHEQGVSLQLLARRIEEDPDFMRRHIRPVDCLTARLETYLGDWDVMFKYQRDGDRVIWCPPQAMTPQGTQAAGRMVSLLPPLPSHGASA